MSSILRRQEDISVFALRGVAGLYPVSEFHLSVSVGAEPGSTCLSVSGQAHLSHTYTTGDTRHC